MICKKLELYRKSTKAYELQFMKDGAGIDITDWTVYFTIKGNVDDDDDDAELRKSVTSHSEPTSGKTLIELTTSDTDIDKGNYYYSIDYKDDEGNEDVLFQGRITILEPVLKTRS